MCQSEVNLFSLEHSKHLKQECLRVHNFFCLQKFCDKKIESPTIFGSEKYLDPKVFLVKKNVGFKKLGTGGGQSV